MSTEHTWRAEDPPIQQAARGIVSHYEGEAWKDQRIEPFNHIEFPKRVDEVACLIAAAPDLLAKLKEVVLVLRDSYQLNCDDEVHPDDYPLIFQCDAVLAKVKIDGKQGGMTK